MLGLLRRHTASDSDDRFVVGLAAAFAAGDGSNREGLLRGKNTGVRQSHYYCFVQTVCMPSTSSFTVVCMIVIEQNLGAGSQVAVRSWALPSLVARYCCGRVNLLKSSLYYSSSCVQGRVLICTPSPRPKIP